MISITRFDSNLSTYVQAWPASIHPLMSTVTHLGDPVTVLSVAVIGAVVAARKNIPGLPNAFMLTIATYGLSVLLKLFLKRTRPDTAYVDEMVFKTYSFPSSHAFGAMVIYGLLAYLAFNHLSRPLNYLVSIALVILILLIGVSRIYLGAHFPGDVIGGWLLGGLCLLLIIKFAVK